MVKAPALEALLALREECPFCGHQTWGRDQFSRCEKCGAWQREFIHPSVGRWDTRWDDWKEAWGYEVAEDVRMKMKRRLKEINDDTV